MQKLLSKCDSVLNYLAFLAIFIIMGLTTADAIGRYVFNRPIGWAYEITEKYLMVLAVFMAAGYAYRRSAYIRVTFFVDRLPRQTRTPVKYFVQVLSILFSLLLVVATTKRAIHMIASGTTLGLLDYPVWPGYVILPIGLFAMSLLMLFDLPRVRTGNSSLFQEEFKEKFSAGEAKEENRGGAGQE